ncbi:DUF159 family protein [Novosphingobium piscinae]|uniref:DUF159 family protein n=1 Tax=Novosphingobium piscinae TaxID=1507448 RepID=A0A7X1G104_9SPHN|nr:DUF159 family protein [Novosphingobium piscinae]MBC2670641.1 DUF159 family protein [Novosphingobium piscinae]
MPPAYALDAAAVAVGRALQADVGADPWSGGEVQPGGYAPVIVADGGGGRQLVPRLWGVPPPPRREHLVPFVRNLDSPFWIGVLRHRQFRCLVPLTRFRRGSQWWEPAGGAISACAGLWRDSEIPSFALLTSGEPAGLPVVLAPAAMEVWLHADIRLARSLVEAGSAAGR